METGERLVRYPIGALSNFSAMGGGIELRRASEDRIEVNTAGCVRGKSAGVPTVIPRSLIFAFYHAGIGQGPDTIVVQSDYAQRRGRYWVRRYNGMDDVQGFQGLWGITDCGER